MFVFPDVTALKIELQIQHLAAENNLEDKYEARLDAAGSEPLFVSSNASGETFLRSLKECLLPAARHVRAVGWI